MKKAFVQYKVSRVPASVPELSDDVIEYRNDLYKIETYSLNNSEAFDDARDDRYRFHIISAAEKAINDNYNNSILMDSAVIYAEFHQIDDKYVLKYVNNQKMKMVGDTIRGSAYFKINDGIPVRFADVTDELELSINVPVSNDQNNSRVSFSDGNGNTFELYVINKDDAKNSN